MNNTDDLLSFKPTVEITKLGEHLFDVQHGLTLFDFTGNVQEICGGLHFGYCWAYFNSIGFYVFHDGNIFVASMIPAAKGWGKVIKPKLSFCNFVNLNSLLETSRLNFLGYSFQQLRIKRVDNEIQVTLSA